jgi:alpha-glucosidase
VQYAGEEAITWSELGWANKAAAGKIKINGSTQQGHQERFAWPLGETDTIQNNYRELIVSCSMCDQSFKIIARVYDGSVAFRYEMPAGKTAYAINREQTSFVFTKPCTIYQYNHESVFTPVAIDSLTKTCDFPATVTNGRFFFSIGEADNTGYTKAELKKGNSANSLHVAFIRDTAVTLGSSSRTPWRTISIATTAIGLHRYSQLYLKLTPPPAAVPSWIKPGKLIRSALNTQAGLDCIDLAARLDFQYILFDAGWYGAEFRSSSDPAQVIPQIDIPEVIRYGKEKGIGVILYVNYAGLRAKLDTILPLYKKWGVRGLKFGFVDGLTQKGISWLAAAIRKVNEYGFILDIHDNYKPTGLSRTYPALLTQEGIRGDENSPDAFHTTVLPFTRFLAGPADFTFCYPNAKNSFGKNLKVSMAQQLALTVIYFSPLQSIFWYGQPKDYTNWEEIEFFKYVPVTWNESHYLKGAIGENISVARRKGADWFIGNAAGLSDWTDSIALDFLAPGKKYIATIYEDAATPTISKRTLSVKRGDRFSFAIKAKGGLALIIRETK